jgi:CBS domain-containing protein
MSALVKVRLPVVMGDTTIDDALKRLEKEGTSAMVILDGRNVAVITDEAVRNALIASGNDSTQPISRVTAGMYTPAPAPAPRWKTLLGTAPAPRSVLATAQDDYVIMDFNTHYAEVATDPDRAAALARPPKSIADRPA